MKRRILLLFVTILIAWTRPSVYAQAVTKDIVADFGAACDGKTDDKPAFFAFQGFALTWQGSNSGLIQLTIPNGRTCVWDNSDPSSPWSGILKLQVSGYGATLLRGTSPGSANLSLGTQGFTTPYFDSYYPYGLVSSTLPRGNPSNTSYANGILPTARIETVTTGSTSVTVRDLSTITHFHATSHSYAMISGIDTQGSGFPYNPGVFEYAFITNVNVSSGVITLQSPLKHTYKSTWPVYNSHAINSGNYDEGGAATIYAMDPTWDTEIEFKGLTILQGSVEQILGAGRSITLTDVTIPNPGGSPIPSQNQIWVANNLTDWTDIEVDKCVETVTYNNSNLFSLTVQSAGSIRSLIVNGTTITHGMGTAYSTTITNSTLDNLGVGPAGYGVTNDVTVTNSTITNASSSTKLAGFARFITYVDDDLTNGVLRRLNSRGPANWAVPGFWYGWSGGGGQPEEIAGPIFQILDMSQDATYTYITTSLSSQTGFPDIPSTGLVYTVPFPAAAYTCTTCSGWYGITQGNSASGRPNGGPLYNYARQSYTGNTLDGNHPQIDVQGTVVSVSLNVTVPYTGTSGTALFELSVLGFTSVMSPGGINPRINFGPIVNMKIAGERIITATTVTGAQSGDTLGSAPGAILFPVNPMYGYSPQNATISGESSSVWPTVIVTINTNTGVTPFTETASYGSLRTGIIRGQIR